MKATVSWEQQAVEQLLELAGKDPRTAKRLAVGIRTHAGGGGGDVRKLEGNATEWRLRVGDWRLIFARAPGILVVDRISNRRDAYSRG